jgi:hypothetical protein
MSLNLDCAECRNGELPEYNQTSYLRHSPPNDWVLSSGNPFAARKSVQGFTASNLLGSCMGGDGQRDSVRHCDTAKANKNLSRNPANRAHHVEEVVRCLSDGTIASSDATFHDELSDVLNLNASHLKNRRVAALHALQKMMKKRGMLNKQRWEKLHEELTGISHTNDLQPFCGVIVYWIRKKLARFSNRGPLS